MNPLLILCFLYTATITNTVCFCATIYNFYIIMVQKIFVTFVTIGYFRQLKLFALYYCTKCLIILYCLDGAHKWFALFQVNN